MLGSRAAVNGVRTMGFNDNCENFRQRFLDDATSIREDRHVATEDGCDNCRQWVHSLDEISAAAKYTPQFDVPEQLTQQIMAGVEQEARRPALLHAALLVPVVAVCLVGACTIAPVDSLEGMLSTALGLVVLAAANLLIHAAKQEESAA